MYLASVIGLVYFTFHISSSLAHRRTHGVDIDSWDFDFSFTGIETYAHLPHVKCLTNPEEAFDIGIIGAPLYVSLLGSWLPGQWTDNIVIQPSLSDRVQGLDHVVYGTCLSGRHYSGDSMQCKASTRTRIGPK